MYNEKIHEGLKNLPSTMPDELLTRKDVCRIFKISLQSVIRMEQAGRLPAVRLGAASVRYQRSAVAKFIQDSITRH